MQTLRYLQLLAVHMQNKYQFVLGFLIASEKTRHFNQIAASLQLPLLDLPLICEGMRRLLDKTAIFVRQ